jgi:LysR family transcriptional regulator, nitrogen assimilation regulatory protein
MTQAATVLGIAQPALSRQVRLLEEDLGVTLFRRTSRGMLLTEEGERLRAAAAGPLRQLELAIQCARSPLARVERSLHLGIPPTAAGTLAAPLLAALGSAFQSASFRVTVAHPDNLIDGMLKGAIDVAVINPVSDDRVFCRDLLVEDLAVIGGPESGLRPDRPVSFTELAGLPLVLPGSRTGIRGTVESAALRLRLIIQCRYSTDSVGVAKDLTGAGLVHGVLPISACGREIEDGRLRYAPLREPTLPHRLCIAASSQLELPRDLAVQIGEILREEPGRLIGSGTWPAVFLAPHRWDPDRP